jgi:hypothetical protein
LKSAKERMDIISAYQQVGSYRGAAELCGTTPKTVKRVVEKLESGEGAPPRAERAHNFDAVAELVAERVDKWLFAIQSALTSVWSAPLCSSERHR